MFPIIEEEINHVTNDIGNCEITQMAYVTADIEALVSSQITCKNQ